MSVRRQGDKWLAIVELGRGEDGRRRRHVITCETEKAALKAEAIAKGKVASGEYFKPAGDTVQAFMREWLDDVKPHVAPATHDRYTLMVERHVIPRLGHLKVRDLTPRHLSRFYAWLRSSGRMPRKGVDTKANPGLSSTTVRKYQMLMHGALKDAVAWGLVQKNAADVLRRDAEDDTEMRVLDLDEQQRLLAVLRKPRSKKNPQPSRLYLPVLVALATGMRRGELLALRWRDIDFAHDRLHVSQALQRTDNGRGWQMGKGKTKGARRIITLPASVSRLLAEHRKDQARVRAIAPDWHAHDLVFCDVVGDPLNLWGFRTTWVRATVAAELEGLRFHDLRHTHATELLRAGVHPKVVAERLGHASVRTTLDRYSHAVPDLQDEAAAKTDVLLRGLLGDAAV